MSRNAMRLTPREDGSRIPKDYQIWTAQQIEGVVDEIYKDIDPIKAWHDKHVDRFRIPTGLYAPLAIIAWELLKRLADWQFGWKL